MRWLSTGIVVLLLAALLIACGGDQPEVAASLKVESAPSSTLPSLAPSVSAYPSPETSPNTAVAGATDTSTEPAPDETPTTTKVALAAITGDPQSYMGQRVTVEGTVENVFGATGFSLDEDAATQGGIDSELLVIGTSQSYPVAITADAGVRVTGNVRAFDLSAIEQEIGSDLDDSLFTDYAGRPTIVADSVQEVRSALDPNAPNPDATTTITSPQAGTDVTVAEIVGNPGRYTNESVRVQEEIERVISPNVFMLDEDSALAGGIDTGLLVVAQTMTSIITDGALVEVGGMVRTFDIAQIEQSMGMDLDDTQLQEYVGQQVIVADYVLDLPPYSPPGALDVDASITEKYGKNITVAEVVGNSADFIGKNVTIRGPVQAVIGENALVVDENALLAGGIDNDLLVVSTTQGITVTTDDLAWVSGTVRMFDRAAIEQEVGFDLQDDEFADYVGRPVIVASSVGVISTPSAIADNPQAYVGRLVSVRGEVEEVIGATAFSLDEDALLEGGVDNDILVISSPDVPPIVQEGIESKTVQVFGTVRMLVTSEVEREFGFDLDDELVVDFEGRPVIIASSVQVAER